MAYSHTEWEIVRAFYERGLSLAEIAARDEVAIKDRASISRKAKKENWHKGEKATLVKKEIETKQAVAEIATEKATLNATELQIHNTIVAETHARTEWLNKAALKNVKEAMAHGCENQNDYRARADTIGKAKDVVIGKTPDTAIQINNNQAVQFSNVEQFREAGRALLADI